MNQATRRLFVLCLLLCLLPLLSRSERPYPLVYPGVEYVQERFGDVPWAIYVVKIDRTKQDFTFTTTLACHTLYGLSPLSRQIAELPAALGTPVAGVNGDFFVIRQDPYQGDPNNLMIMQGELISTPGTGDAFWIDREGQPRIGHVTAQLCVTWPDQTETPLGLNEERREDAAVLYTPTLGPSTRTTGGREFVLERAGDTPWLPLRAGQTFKVRVREIRETGDSALTPDTLILSAGPQLLPRLPALTPGAVIRLTLATTPDLTGVHTAIGGRPILVQQGKGLEPTTEPQPRHPRTILGWNTKQYFLITIDGRQTDLSAGMTYTEEAALAIRLGCTEAINLDGGGSSTLWLGGKIMNSPSDGKERDIANGLVVLKK